MLFQTVAEVQLIAAAKERGIDPLTKFTAAAARLVQVGAEQNLNLTDVEVLQLLNLRVATECQLYAVHARLWIGVCVVGWGLTATLMAFIQDGMQFYGLRVLLGIFTGRSVIAVGAFTLAARGHADLLHPARGAVRRRGGAGA